MKAIVTKYHGPTDTRGSRVSATDGDFRITVSGDTDGDAHDNAAIALCRKIGWSGTLLRGGTKTGNVYVWCNFFGNETDKRDTVEVP